MSNWSTERRLWCIKLVIKLVIKPDVKLGQEAIVCVMCFVFHSMFLMFNLFWFFNCFILFIPQWKSCQFEHLIIALKFTGVSVAPAS